MKLWDDTHLFATLKEGDKEALSVLFLRYYDYLKHYGLQISHEVTLVEECIQELFIYMFESYGRLGNVKQVKAYLFKSLRRRLLEKLKKERGLMHTESDFNQLTDFQFSSEDIHIQQENNTHIRKALAKALNELPWRQREAVYLRYYNSLSTQEIAEVMDVANQTILNTIHQAIKKIRKDKQLNQVFGLKDSLTS